VLEKISITMMSGPRDGEILVFQVNYPSHEAPMVLTIGRRDGSDIRLNYDSQVSRLHAHLGFDGKNFWLEDMESRNGTFVKDQRLDPGQRVEIEAGTLFRVGRTWLRLDPLPNDITAAADPFPVVNIDQTQNTEIPDSLSKSNEYQPFEKNDEDE
jgi:pSer/pThr/pTyr-binding forkhead associated (FHA) protein